MADSTAMKETATRATALGLLFVGTGKALVKGVDGKEYYVDENVRPGEFQPTDGLHMGMWRPTDHEEEKEMDAGVYPFEDFRKEVKIDHEVGSVLRCLQLAFDPEISQKTRKLNLEAVEEALQDDEIFARLSSSSPHPAYECDPVDIASLPKEGRLNQLLEISLKKD